MKTRKPAVRTNPAGELYADALDAARRLKKEHGRYFRTNPQDFRRQVRTAHSRIFRRKPGPKGDVRIARAARQRANGARWDDLIKRYLELPGKIGVVLARAGNRATDAPNAQQRDLYGQQTEPFMLHDGTPVRLRLNRNISSADAQVGESVDFEVLDDVKINDIVIIARASTALATVAEAEPKKRMACGGMLNVNIDSVRLVDDEKIALRAIKEGRAVAIQVPWWEGWLPLQLSSFPQRRSFCSCTGRTSRFRSAQRLRRMSMGK